MNDDVETFQHAGFKVRIVYDQDAPSPREMDNLATMVCWHDHNRMGDVQRNRHSQDCSAKAIIREVRQSGDKVLAMLPLYLYSHSGDTIRTTPFGDRWDSGQVGWAYVTRKSAEAMGCVGDRHDHVDGKAVKVGTWDKAALENAIRQEVENYDEYIRGECYGYIVEDKGGEEVPDGSCWGFVGDLPYVRKEAMGVAEHAEARDKRDRKRLTKAKWKAAVKAGTTEDGYEDWYREERAKPTLTAVR